MLNDVYVGEVTYPFILSQKGNTIKILNIGSVEYIYQENGEKVTLIPYETDGLQIIHLEKVK